MWFTLDYNPQLQGQCNENDWFISILPVLVIPEVEHIEFYLKTRVLVPEVVLDSILTY